MTSLATLESLYPRRGQSLAVVCGKMDKRAALLFDRIHHESSSPEGKFEISSSTPAEVLFAVPSISRAVTNDWMSWMVKKASKQEDKAIPWIDAMARRARTTVKLYGAKGWQVTPIYPDDEHMDVGLKDGPSIAFEAAIASIQIPAEDAISWEQVLEFRRDREIARKHRALRLWLVDALKAQSPSHAQEIIEQRISEYEWSIRKHGLSTTVGTLKAVLDSKSLSAVATGGVIGALVGGPIFSALTAGLLLTSRVAVAVAERHIERESVRRGPGSEVALLYEARQQFKANA